jgi:TnpA family transposase
MLQHVWFSSKNRPQRCRKGRPRAAGALRIGLSLIFGLVLTRPIDWGLIRQQYDQMVKYATALRLRTAIKTIFLSRYLHNEAFRREIYEGLNVVEQWNSATDFVFLRVPWGTRQQSS